MKIVIVGGGIGGLTTGIALQKKGVEVQILEAANELTEVGAGIQIGANGTRVLRELGVEEDVRNVGVQPDAWEFRDLNTADVVYRPPLKREDGTDVWGVPLYNVHRADLVEILGRHAGLENLVLGERVNDISQDKNGVIVTGESGKQYKADAAIGADGINSVVRQKLWGETERRFAGYLMWRALLTADEVRDIDLPERGNYWTGPGRTLITYWLRPKKLYSILATVPSDEVTREAWDLNGDINDLKASFEDIEPRAAAMLSKIEEAFITGMYFRDPVEQWSDGKITLMGDAAHPMTPYYAQGATQSFEDAWVLAEMVKRYGKNNIAEAFSKYEAFRRPRAERLQSGSRRMVKITHERDSIKIRARNGLWKGQRRLDPDLRSDFEFVWGYDIIKSLEGGAERVKGLSGTYVGLKKIRAESQKALEMWLEIPTAEYVARGYEGLRDGYDEMLLRNCAEDPRVVQQKEQVFGVRTITVSWPKEEYTRDRTVILHSHGGGYMLGSAESSVGYVSRLLKAMKGEKAITVDYRKGPENPYPAALNDMMAVYRDMLQAGTSAENIILSGESSGGGLAVALGILIKMAQLPMPKGIIVVAPFADLTLSGESVEKWDGYDAAANPDTLRMMAEGYFQEHEPRDPLISPIYGNLEGLPPILITASKDEVLYDDARRLADVAKRDGVAVETIWVDDSVHVYPFFEFLPETRKFMERTLEWKNSLG